MIAKNELQVIGTALSSCQILCDEMIVIDTGSTDGTIEIAKSYGAKVFSHEWAGFSDARNRSLKEAASEWVLYLDADEELMSGAAEHIREAIESAPAEVDGFYLTLYQPLDDGSNLQSPIVRVFRKNKAHFEGAIHNRLRGIEKVGWCHGNVKHHRHGGDSVRNEERDKQTGILMSEELKNKPDDIWTVFNWARWLSCVGRYEEAIPAALKVIRLLKTDKTDGNQCYVSMYFTLFNACLQIKDVWTPEGHLLYITREMPRYIDGHFALGVVYSLRDEVTLAEDYFGRHARLTTLFKQKSIPTLCELWTVNLQHIVEYHLGMMYKRQAGKFDECKMNLMKLGAGVLSDKLGEIE